MPTTSFDKESIKASIIGKLQRYNGRTIQEASNAQIYRALASTVRDQIMQKWMISREERKRNNTKRLYYLSVEFLMGRSLYTNILNLVSTDEYKAAIDELGIDIDAVLKEEPEPALGNGGLGRLAACFMDSLASLDLPAMGSYLLRLAPEAPNPDAARLSANRALAQKRRAAKAAKAAAEVSDK